MLIASFLCYSTRLLLSLVKLVDVAALVKFFDEVHIDEVLSLKIF